MADSATPAPAHPQPAPTDRDTNSNRGGRRRGRGGGGGGGGSHAATSTDDNRGARSGGRGGRNRGGGGGSRDRGGRGPNNTRTHGGGQPPGENLKGAGTFGDRLTGDAKTTEGESAEDGKGATAGAAVAGKKGHSGATEEEADDGEVCFICASRVEHTSVAPCNHRTCHICALRLRALYKTKACAHCRTESPFVIFTDDPAKRFEEFSPQDLIRTDENLGIKYETDEVFQDTVLLLRYNCPDDVCDVACLGWPDLHRHVKSKHGKVMCDLCTRNKKVFTHEHELFTMNALRKHEKYGDDNPGSMEQSGFRGHPECGFCRQRFYGDDELYAHCRDKHERCHICDRRSEHRQQQYYINYDALEEHFQKDHFLCLDKECLEKKFVVFESQMDLKAHQLDAHPGEMSKDVRRDARTVDISSFDYRTPYQPQRQQRRGAGRGRDPNSEPLPQSSAQPLRRDELAYQRQMAIHSAQSVSNRSFGGQLTPSATQTVRAPARPAAQPTARPPVAAMESLSLEADSAPATPQEQARRLRHNTVMERASSLLGNDQLKIADFRSKVSSYKNSALSATELIDGFFSLFDTPASELGKLIKELAELYEDDSKRSALLKSWNDWRAINEDYPALPGPSGAGIPGFSPNTTGAVGNRVLRLKSSTAQSSRSAMGRSGTLAGGLNPHPYNSPTSSSNAFPPLSSSRANTSSTKVTTTPWAASPAAPSSRASPASSRPSSRPPARDTGSAPRSSGAAEFPALPTAAKPNVLMAGLTRGTVRWDSGAGNTQNAWAGSNSGPSPGANFAESENNIGGKKGKGKKGKQTLFHFG